MDIFTSIFLRMWALHPNPVLKHHASDLAVLQLTQSRGAAALQQPLPGIGCAWSRRLFVALEPFHVGIASKTQASSTRKVN